ncbi:MAG: molybdopterin-dependent oxidoreductase, partial [Proteobacteria bacterium]|nr:molybdopterin-dependent oxidoreductase [Pseudomonadota bacterium]
GVKLSGLPGRQLQNMFEGMADGSIKAFYVCGENPANSDPDSRHVEHCLDRVEFMIAQDLFLTETARFADVVFPAAAWAEGDGTFSNSERRVSRVRKAVDPPGQAKPDWWIVRELARRMGHDWAADTPRRIWDEEIAPLTPQMAGITYRRLEGDGLQWPVPTPDHPGTTCLHRNGEFTCGLGVFKPVEFRPPAELPDEEFPLVLTTGRRLPIYHTHTQTSRSQGIPDLLPEDYLEINPADAGPRGIEFGDVVEAATRRGQIKVKAWVTDRVPPGTVFVTFHFRDTNANWLTNPAYDPVCGTPEFKACAVEIKKAA